MILLINKLPVPACQGCKGASGITQHWAVEDIAAVLGRDLLAADTIEYREEETRDDNNWHP